MNIIIINIKSQIFKSTILIIFLESLVISLVCCIFNESKKLYFILTNTKKICKYMKANHLFLYIEPRKLFYSVYSFN